MIIDFSILTDAINSITQFFIAAGDTVKTVVLSIGEAIKGLTL